MHQIHHMDKIAIISDIHGNIPALEAVIADIRQRGIEIIYNLGDLIGKGPHSDIAVDQCRELCDVIVRGNWDEGIIDFQDPPATDWYRAQLGKERIDYLQNLPNAHDFWLSGMRVRLFHASQISTFQRRYPHHPYEDKLAMFDNTDFTGYDAPPPDIVGYGDIHTAFMYPLHRDQKTLFNVGSVGNPLDFPLATYVILSGKFDSQTKSSYTIDFARVPYDIEKTLQQAKAIEAPDYDVYSVELRQALYRGKQKQQNGNG